MFKNIAVKLRNVFGPGPVLSNEQIIDTAIARIASEKRLRQGDTVSITVKLNMIVYSRHLHEAERILEFHRAW